MSAEKPILPDELLALFDGVDSATLAKFAGDYAVRAAIREMLGARTERQRQLAFVMARIASDGRLPTTDFAPSTQLTMELGLPKRPGIIRRIRTTAVDLGLHRIISDTCVDGFKPTPPAKQFHIGVGDTVSICSREIGPASKLEYLIQVTAGLGVWLIKQATSRPVQITAIPDSEQSPIPLVLERFVADDIQIIPPVANLNAIGSQAAP